VNRPIEKWDVFHYVYAVLHHPEYRSRFGDVLRKELPRIPMLPEFGRYAAIGRELAGLHVHYEAVPPHPGVQFRWAADRPQTWRVERMKLNADETELVVNESLTLAGIPPEAARYRLGNRSALGWVVDQHRVNPRTGEDPNRPDDERHIVDLARRVAAVAARTVALVESLPAWAESPSRHGVDSGETSAG
jgi:predicted helicase